MPSCELGTADGTFQCGKHSHCLLGCRLHCLAVEKNCFSRIRLSRLFPDQRFHYLVWDAHLPTPSIMLRSYGTIEAWGSPKLADRCQGAKSSFPTASKIIVYLHRQVDIAEEITTPAM